MLRHASRKGFTLVELMVVIGILGLLVGILAVAVLPKLFAAKAQLEIKQLGDVVQGIQQAANDNNAKKRMSQPKVKDAMGRAFWENMFKLKILDTEYLKKVVSMGSNTDVQAESTFIDGEGKFEQTNCSYTSPKMGKLFEVMQYRGKQKCVVICFDSRNWNNYDKSGVLVSWSEGDSAAYLQQVDAEAEYKISKADWDRPAEVIIGKKAPFQHTFEEGNR